MLKRTLLWGALLLSIGCLAKGGLSLWNAQLRQHEAANAKGLPLDPREIHFVPTPMPVLEEMLRHAELTEEDVVVDLGCGDGRLVIQAAKRYGCRGRGYDIDPELIRQCRESALENGVEQLVEFHIQDIYEIDISDATVALLYLLPEMNLKLLPQLQTMSDSSRYITHDFEIPGVSAINVYPIEDKTGPKYLHAVHRVFVYHAPLRLDPAYQPEEKQFRRALQYAIDHNVQFATSIDE